MPTCLRQMKRKSCAVSTISLKAATAPRTVKRVVPAGIGGAWSGRADEDGGEEDLEELLESEEEVPLLARPVRPEDGLVGCVGGCQDRSGWGDEGVHEHLRGIGRLERREDEIRILRPDVLQLTRGSAGS